jgi:hypothetical protein
MLETSDVNIGTAGRQPMLTPPLSRSQSIMGEGETISEKMQGMAQRNPLSLTIARKMAGTPSAMDPIREDIEQRRIARGDLNPQELLLEYEFEK